MEWYRRYHGTCRDQKLEMVARSASLPRPFAIAGWDAVLEYASAQDDRGSVAGLTAEWLSITIGCEEDEAKRLLRAMLDKGLVSRDPSRVVAWDKRQPADPTAAERMKRMRDRKRAANGAVAEPPNGSAPPANGDDSYDVTAVTGRNVTALSEQSRTEEIETHEESESLPSQTAPPDGGRRPTGRAVLMQEIKDWLGGANPGGQLGGLYRDYGEGATIEAYFVCLEDERRRDGAIAGRYSWLKRKLVPRKKDAASQSEDAFRAELEAHVQLVQRQLDNGELEYTKAVGGSWGHA